MSTVTLSPNTLIGNSGISVVGTGSVLTALSDASDATYIVGTTNNGYAKLHLTSTTIAPQRIRSTLIRVRDAHDSSGGGPETGIAFLYDTKGPGRSAQMDLNRTATSVAAQIGGLDTHGAPAGQPWTQALLDRLAIQVQLFGTSDWLRVHKLEVDVELNTRPVTSAVTVTGFTTSTQPDVSWTFTQAEGFLQSRYRVLIYSAAQFGAAGFSAGVSAATWDSGDQFGDANDVPLVIDLTNGTTYRAYVKTAMDWPGPEGQLWWSTYVASSSFTVTVVPPATPSLTVVGEPTLPGYRNRVTVSLAGFNLLDTDTASFEGGTIGGWVAGANTNTPTVSATNPKSGINDMLLTATAAGTIEALSGTFASAERVKPGTVVSATASFRALVTGRITSVGIRFFDVSGVTISTPMSSTVTDTTTGYVTPTLANQAVPANAYSAVVRVLIGGTAALGEQHRVDEAGLLIGPSATWSQGGYGGGSVLVQRSQRVSPNIGRGPARNWVHPQVYSGGALTTGTDGFYPRQANDSVIQRRLDRPAPESPVTGTAGMIEWQIRVGSFSYVDIGAPDAVATDGQHPYMFPAVPSLAFTGSVWLWGSAAITIRLGLIFTDAFNTQVGSTTLTANTALTTTAQKVAVAATAPAGTVYARMVVEDTLAATGISVFIAQPKFRPSFEPDEAWPGTTWSFAWDTMRGTPWPLPTTGDDTLVLYDHEAPPGRPIMYQAQILAAAPDGTSVSSAPSIPVSTYMDEPTRNLLKDPLQGENAMIVNIAPDWSEQQAVDATVFHPLGRDAAANGTADPIQIRDWLGGQDGSYVLSTLTELELYRLRNLTGANTPLLIQWAEGGQTYVLVADGSATARSSRELFRTTVKTVQCARPA